MYIWQQTPEKRHVKETEEGWRNKKAVDRGREEEGNQGKKKQEENNCNTQQLWSDRQSVA